MNPLRFRIARAIAYQVAASAYWLCLRRSSPMAICAWPKIAGSCCSSASVNAN